MTNEELVNLYQNGDKHALDEIVEKNTGIIYKIVNKFYVEKTNSIDREDLIQEGYVGLINAAKRYKFDIKYPCKFITYAVYWIYQKMNRFVKYKNTNHETSINTPIGDDKHAELQDFIEGKDYGFENVEEKIYNKQLHEELETVMSQNNTLREREVLKFHYGWDNNKSLSYDAIGELFDVSWNRIYQIETKALRKLRDSKWGRKKMLEYYDIKKQHSMYNIPNTVECISFAQRYLCDKVI